MLNITFQCPADPTLHVRECSDNHVVFVIIPATDIGGNMEVRQAIQMSFNVYIGHNTSIYCPQKPWSLLPGQ